MITKFVVISFDIIDNFVYHIDILVDEDAGKL